MTEVLRWNHDWGTKAEHFEKQFAMGRRVPAGFHDRPEILPIAVFHWQAFCALETERYIGVAVGPIPRSAARDYAIEHGIDDADDLADFCRVIARLDGAASTIRRPARDDDGKVSEKVSMQDTGGIKSMMRRLGRKPRK